MSDWEIEYLGKVLQESHLKVFYNLAGEWVVVTRMGTNAEEEGPVAYINRGIGHNIALWNCDINDFYVAAPLIGVAK